MPGRILVVDDEKAMLLALRGLLAKEGYAVETAGNGEEALRRHGGNITKAAEEVGMYRQNFQQKMRELGITAD